MRTSAPRLTSADAVMTLLIPLQDTPSFVTLIIALLALTQIWQARPDHPLVLITRIRVCTLVHLRSHATP